MEQEVPPLPTLVVEGMAAEIVELVGDGSERTGRAQKERRRRTHFNILWPTTDLAGRIHADSPSSSGHIVCDDVEDVGPRHRVT